MMIMERERKSLTQEQQEQFSNLLKDNEDILKQFLRDYKRHPEAWDVMSSEKKLQNFAATLTVEDLENCFGKENISEEVAKTFSSGTDSEKLNVLDSFSMNMIVALYKYKNPKEYRTISKAGADITRTFPEHIPTPTLPNYEYATSLKNQGNAYMIQIMMSMDKLEYKNGKLYFKGELEAVSEARLRRIAEDEKEKKTKIENSKAKKDEVTSNNDKEGSKIEPINLPFLKFYYGILTKKYEESINKSETIPEVTTIYLPDLAEARGLGRNINKNVIQTILNDISGFHNIAGIVKTNKNGRYYESIFPVLLFTGYDAEKNTVSISSPYLLRIVKGLYSASISKDKTGRPKLKKDGTPKRIPINSYLVKREIMKERNKAAVENVFIIVTGIEQAGRNGYHINIATLIERNPQLYDRIQKSKNPTRILQTCFKKTWELLDTMTDLKKRYKNIELPDPNDPSVIPTVRTKDRLVIHIKHDGKI